jgi:hypothetical protein
MFRQQCAEVISDSVHTQGHQECIAKPTSVQPDTVLPTSVQLGITVKPTRAQPDITV